MDALRKIGLTDGEIKAYQALLSLGPSRSSQIARSSGLSGSKITDIIERLVSKGICSTYKKDKCQYYKAADPASLLGYVDALKEEVMQSLPELERNLCWLSPEESTELFEGKRGVTTMIHALIEQQEKHEYLFFAIHRKEFDDEIRRFFRRIDAKRAKNCTRVRGLSPPDLKSKFEGRDMEVRYPEFPIPHNITIVGNKVGIINWKQNPTAYLITSDVLSEMFRRHFYKVWDMS